MTAAVFRKASICLLQVALVWVGLQTKPETIRGHITAVGEKSIMVGTAADQRSFMVTDATKITLDGQAAKLTDLPVGSPVAVVAESAEKDAKAVSIDAMTMKRSGEGNPTSNAGRVRGMLAPQADRR